MIKWLRNLLVFVAVVLLLFALRVPILKGLSSYLTKTDAPQKVDVIFVLSGAAYDRGMKAADMYKQGCAPRIVCTGGNKDGNALALGREYLECELTRSAVLLTGVDSSVVTTLPEGTSTFEESEAIEKYCIDRNIRSCIVVTSLFHTRRVASTVKKRLERAGIDTYLVGAPSRFYEPTAWWKSEYGLLDVNNEYVKLAYYLVKY